MNESELLPWTEKYRPLKLEDVAGQEGVVKTLRAFVKANNMPNLLFAGPPGVGKTTSAMAMAHELYADEMRGNFGKIWLRHCIKKRWMLLRNYYYSPKSTVKDEKKVK